MFLRGKGSGSPRELPDAVREPPGGVRALPRAGHLALLLSGQPGAYVPAERSSFMGNYNPAMQKVRLADIENDVHGLIAKRTAELDGVSVTEVTFGPGAKWSTDLRDHAGTELCELPHVALVIEGRLAVRMADESLEEFSAGDVMLLPPGHDAWTVGAQACTFVEFSRGNDYYS
jgi:hypothetical protein